MSVSSGQKQINQDRKKKISNILPVTLFIFTLVLILLLLFIIKTKKEDLAAKQSEAISNKKPPVNVIVMETGLQEIKDKINLPGIIEPWSELQMLARISGTVQEVLAKEGDRVEKGDDILLIDPTDYEIAFAAAKAEYDLASANRERGRKLFDKGFIPQAELDRLKSLNLTAKAAMDNAKLQLDRCRIKAPISGIIKKIDAEEGLFVSMSDPLCLILQIDKVKGVVGIPESDVAAVQKVDTVEITIKALNDLKLTGKKYFLSPAPENMAMLYRMELTIDNTERMLLPGMFIRAEIVKEVASEALSVPLYTVISRGNEQFVFVEDNGTARRRDVKIGILEGWRVQVTEGLVPGSHVIIEGHRNVEEGQPVNVVRVLKDTEEMLP